LEKFFSNPGVLVNHGSGVIFNQVFLAQVEMYTSLRCKINAFAKQTGNEA
jgi:hypothetical protein